MSQLSRSDRGLRRVLVDGLLTAVSKNRLALDEMIGRLDRLSLAVQKRNRMRQVVHAMDLFLQSVNEIDFEPLLDRADGASWILAQPHALQGSAYCDVAAGENLEPLELLIGSLPSPKVRTPAAEPLKSRAAIAVPPQASEIQQMEKPFAREHLEAMLRLLVDTGEPQSAADYWKAHGDRAVSTSIWLYALDGYVQLQLALNKTLSKTLNYRLHPTFETFSRASANRRVLDLTLEKAVRPK